MHWSNVKLIFLREVRDQLRDRRTLFLIAVLPLLLYPLLGISLMQLSQFLTTHASKVLIVGLAEPKGLPPLVEKNRFAQQWFVDKAKVDLLDVELQPTLEAAKPAGKGKAGHAERTARESRPTGAAAGAAPTIESGIRDLMQEPGYDVVVYFPADFAQRLEQFRQELRERREHPDGHETPVVPAPELYYTSVKEKSEVAYARVDTIVRAWRDAIGQQNLTDNHVPVEAAQPFQVQEKNIAEPVQRQAAVWAKLLPMVLLLWALTGAFYPAIDLCAGEKERGTLETLLSSPAQRSEIVAGKLLTVMSFSMATSLLNLASLAVTGVLFVQRIQTSLGREFPLGLPPLATLPWLLMVLVPVAALFSALCLALAVFARSTKEGQYYLMPLVLVTLPLLILPMSPGVELTLGNSLIPLTGLMLLLKMLLEGNGLEALKFVLPVALVTGACCWVAIRWAIDQFNTESVLFRESERLDLRLWLKHLRRDRGDTPTVGAAVLCGVLILVLQFFVGLWMSLPAAPSFHELALLIMVSQLVIVLPALAMTGLLTRRPTTTLLLRPVRARALWAALALAVAVHPVNYGFQLLLQKVYPPPPEQALGGVQAALSQAPYWWLPLLLIGLLPAVVEELTFRGFILSGLRHSGHKWRAILISALFFAASHQILQQSIGAFLLGTMLGYIAVQTGSLWPGLLFHVAHNSLVWLHTLLQPWFESLMKHYPDLLGWLGSTGAFDSFVLLGVIAILWLLGWFSRLTYTRTDEEQLSETIAEEAADALRG